MNMYDHLYKSRRRQLEETGRAMARRRNEETANATRMMSLHNDCERKGIPAAEPRAPQAPAPPERSIADLKAPAGGYKLSSYAQKTSTDRLFGAYGDARGWPQMFANWTDEQASEAYEAVVRGNEYEKLAFRAGTI